MPKPVSQLGGETDQPVSWATQRLALIIPTLREADNLCPLIDRIHASLEPLAIPYELIVVDDDSRDGIDAVMAQIAQRDPRARLLTRTGRRGLARAVVHGWKSTDAEYLGVIDADLQHPPELLPELWRALTAGADVVVASRYAPPRSRPNWRPFRHLISEVAVWMTWPLQRPGLRVKDPMSGFFLVRRSCIEGIEFHQLGFKILLEILVRGKIRCVVEVPFTFGQRYAGRSKISLGAVWEYLILLGKLWRERPSGSR